MPVLTERCTTGSPAEQAYCRALALAARAENCRTGMIEERLDCLERKLAIQSAQIEWLSDRVREFLSPASSR